MKKTAHAVQNIWVKTEIPIIATKSIVNKTETLINSYCSFKKKKTHDSYEHNASILRCKLESEFFDIAKCKCIERCTCLKNHKVPLFESEFLSDQRNTREMVLITNSTRQTISVFFTSQ